MAVHGTDYNYDRVVQALAFQAVLVPYSPLAGNPQSPVIRTIAIRDDQTLEQLHEALRLAFGWAETHLYSFWLTGEFWDDRWQAGGEFYPMLVEAEGVPPPQYPELEEDE